MWKQRELVRNVWTASADHILALPPFPLPVCFHVETLGGKQKQNIYNYPLAISHGIWYNDVALRAIGHQAAGDSRPPRTLKAEDSK